MCKNKQPHSILITDGLWRKSLSAIRSLGKAGYHPTVMGDSLFTIGFWSSFTCRRVIAPTAAYDSDQFGRQLLRELEELSHRFPSVVLLPMEDASVMWVAAHIEKIDKLAHVLLPSLEALNMAQDKSATIKVAVQIGLPCPKTWHVEQFDDFIDVINNLKDEDYVVKPCRGSGSSGIVYGNRRPEGQWTRYWEKYRPVVVQERIPREGEGLGVCLLMDREGECIASFAHKRLKEYPVSGGPSTDRVSIHAPELVDNSIKLLKKLAWRGVAMVEWKMDPRDRTAKLMEINPRFWGSLELDIRAGVDFPLLYAKAALGEEVIPTHQYAEGVRCRWIQGDIMRYLSQPRDKRENLSEFLKGFFSLSEEWNKEDVRGWLASWLCIPGLALTPRYWKYVRRH
ncbi:MAG: ATP-grasp domain-containing protein [Dissulfurispiraceae bacterium]